MYMYILFYKFNPYGVFYSRSIEKQLVITD